METPYDTVFEAMTVDVMDALPADRWAVARITAYLIRTNPQSWSVLPGEEALREGRFGCCRMTYAVTYAGVEIQGIGWVEDYG